LWSAIPFAVLFWLTFTTPGFGDSGKLVYAYLTYGILMVFYTINNVPYASLNGVMTGDVHERTSLSQFRFFAVTVTALVVQGLTLPLVGKFGGGDDQKGWSITIGIYASVAVVFFVIAFLSVKERIQPPAGQKTTVRSDLRDLTKNRAWIAMFGVALFVFVTLSLRGSSMFYFFRYYLDPDATSAFLAHLGLVVPAGEALNPLQSLGKLFGLVLGEGAVTYRVAFSLYNVTGNMVCILGVVAAKPLSRLFGKKVVFACGLGLSVGVILLNILWSPTQVWGPYVGQIFWGLFYGPTIPLLWAMIADAADFGEWKLHRRATAIVFSGVVFALKFGLAVGGTIALQVLSAFDYVPNVAQTERAIWGIRLTPTIVAAIPFALGAICACFFPLTKNLTLQMGDELAARRRAAAGAEPTPAT
jgi:Na+/melibiose symporter-like transporter